MMSEPTQEHRWLEKFVGNWASEVEAVMEPGAPAVMMRGTESVRSIGGLWVVAEGRGEMPGGGEATMLLTLGYDTASKRYVGTWVGSMMATLWVYNGTVDVAGKILTLNTEGPNCMNPESTKPTKYRDVTEFRSNDHRVMQSWMQGEDGEWTSFMTAHYRRV